MVAAERVLPQQAPAARVDFLVAGVEVVVLPSVLVQPLAVVQGLMAS